MTNDTNQQALPEEFRSFCDKNGIPTSIFTVQPSRYIRLNPRHITKHANISQDLDNKEDQEEYIQEGNSTSSKEKYVLEEEIRQDVKVVKWLPGKWWRLPAATKLANLESYKNACIYGLDAASGSAALALDVSAPDVTKVLDLCCAPGAKLCLLADMNPNCKVVGVDVAENRLAVCRTILQKYQVPNATVVRADGRTFSLQNWDVIDDLFLAEKTGHGKKGRKRKREQVLKENGFGDTVPAECNTTTTNNTKTNFDVRQDTPSILFDRVLVDAECTHDGSVKHIEKFQSQWGVETLARRVPWLTESQLTDLVHLQKSLLINGWRNLKSGGVLVYSTCSFAECQNEEVIEWFVTQSMYKDEVVLDPLPFSLQEAKAKPGRFNEAMQSLLPEKDCVARFNPVDSDTSGLFLARLRKKK